MRDLSILIPARNEMFLSRTIEDILKNMRGDTEIITVLDGAWADPPIQNNPRVTIIFHAESIGQRAAVNEAAKISTAKYLMKVDAHCSFDEGFDVKLMETMDPNWTVVPVMRNLHAFDWVCENGHRRYQGPSGPCTECGLPTTRDIVWRAKTSPQSTSYCFDATPHFQYFGEFKKRPEGQGDLTETMSLQGSCFMLTRDKFFELEVCDEDWGSWGSQGIEVAVKTWLSGGLVLCNHRTWYAHMFRTQGGDFGFPYPISGRQVEHAKGTARKIFFTNSWEKQVHPLSWLVKKFWPIPGWTEEDLKALDPQALTKGVLYYTDNRLDPTVFNAVQNQIRKSVNGHRIISVSLQPTDLGDNIHLNKERGYLTMFEQILTGLEAMTCDIVYFCEHDVLYHPSHFEFVPPERDKFYYNTNVWKVDYSTGHALHYDCKQTSGLVAYREVLVEHYRERVRRVREEGFSRRMGFEPGTHNRPERVDNRKSESFVSTYPNLDIRHDKNLTPNRWRQEQFRNKSSCQGWMEAESVYPWYEEGHFHEILKEI